MNYQILIADFCRIVGVYFYNILIDSIKFAA
mgnify:CR=1 FL=1